MQYIWQFMHIYWKEGQPQSSIWQQKIVHTNLSVLNILYLGLIRKQVDQMQKW